MAIDSVEETKDYYTMMNLEQMMNGKRRDGKDITPYYWDDPYFKSYSQAMAYSDWKDRIEPFKTKRRPGVPNLYINGYYHNSISSKVGPDGISLNSKWGESSEIESKYTRMIYGIGGQWREWYFNDGYMGLRKAWRKRFEAASGLKLSK